MSHDIGKQALSGESNMVAGKRSKSHAALYWGVPLAINIFLAIIFLTHRMLTNQPGITESEFAQVNRRDGNLEVSIVSGYKDRHPVHGWEIEIGSAEIRLIKAGFLRLGAFNEVIIHDFHINLRSASTLFQIIELLKTPESRPHNIKSHADHDFRMAPLFGHLGVHSAQAQAPVSKILFRRFSIRQFNNSDNEEFLFLSAERARAEKRGLLMSGEIVLGDQHHYRIISRFARMNWTEDLMMTLHEPTLLTTTETQRLQSISISLNELWRNSNLPEIISNSDSTDEFGSTLPLHRHFE